MCTQSTTVLHKYLNDELKLLLQFFSLRLHRIPGVFHAQREIPGIPGLWPPCRRPRQAHKKAKLSPTHYRIRSVSFSVATVIFTARCYASAVLAMGLCLSASATSRCSIKTAERIELVFGTWASFHPSYTVLKGNSIISKNKGTSLWNFVLNSGLRGNFATAYRSSKRVINLARERWTLKAW